MKLFRETVAGTEEHLDAHGRPYGTPFDVYKTGVLSGKCTLIKTILSFNYSYGTCSCEETISYVGQGYMREVLRNRVLL